MDQLFINKSYTFYHTWQGAYPALVPLHRWPPLILDTDGLYYLNAMETPFSVMETEIVSAKNIVNLLKKNHV
jgi:prenylcysteine oxidase/farnesylcysteine lyase